VPVVVALTMTDVASRRGVQVDDAVLAQRLGVPVVRLDPRRRDVHTLAEAVGEALLFASKMGADPAKVRQALMGGFASSRVLEVHGERMIKRTFDPGFRIELHQKDLNLALSSARAAGISLPNTATAQELFNACAARGGKAWDHSAMVRALELLANHEVAKAG
jgi:hypothetical protein